MSIDAHYAYFILTLPFVAIWISLFIFCRNTRGKQLEASMFGLPLGTFFEILYFKDYWNPGSIFSFHVGPLRFTLEDFMFSFALFGISAVIFEVLYGKRLVSMESNFQNSIFVRMVLVGIIFACISLPLFFLGINSIFATSLAFLTTALLILSKRRDLAIKSLLSGFSVMLLMFFIYFVGFRLVLNSEGILRAIWFLYGTPFGIKIGGVPVTEMVWGFSFGMWFSSAYPFVRNLVSR